MYSVHMKARKMLLDGLVDLGIIKKRLSEKKKTELINRFFPHSIGHHLGLDVHDPVFWGYGKKTAKMPLPVNSVVTIEPGLYFQSEDETLPKEIRGIGIRLENTVHVKKDKSDEIKTGFSLEPDFIENVLS